MMNTATTEPDAPYIWTPERFTRVWLLRIGDTEEPRRYRGICWLCGLPGLELKPAGLGKSKKRPSWCAHCRCCGSTTFAAMPRMLWAPTELMWLPYELNPAKLGAFVEGLVSRGGEAMPGLRFELARFGKTERPQLNQRLACLSCGEPNSAHARKDKHGLEYTVCMACGTRTFMRSQHVFYNAVGWTVWLREGNTAAWLDAWRSGARRWRGWLDEGRLDEQQSSEHAAGQEAHREAR
jgi:transcription elongation factor Elf1